MATGVSPPAANRCQDEGDDGRPREQPPIQPPRAIKQPHRVGYDCEFVERPPKAFQCECPVCLLILREPHQVTCCGYSFCATCVKRVQEDKKPCPTCNEADFNVYSNKGLKRTLNEYRVYCCQRGEGCDWVGELGELDRHLNLQPPPEKLLVGCQFSEVDCTHCIQPFQRRYVQAHQSDDCAKRPYECQHCSKYAATFKATYEEVTQNHWPVCPFFPLSCPNNCELVLQRQEVEHHVSRACPLTLVHCEFQMVGCEVRLPRRDMPSHISDSLAVHVSLQQKHMCVQQQMLIQLQATLTSQGAELTQYKHKNQLLREALTASEQKVETQQATLTALQATIGKQQQVLDIITCTGTLPFEFTMTEFEEHKRASDEWYSPPFYTHTHGYRMCIKVFANGFGSNEGKHLSIFSFLMRGDFDNVLQWPYQGTITIDLLNQLQDANHCTRSLCFTFSDDFVGLQRVTSGERAQRSCGGAYSLIPHTQLGLSQKCQYLRYNQLKFRVSKATNLNPTARIHRRCLALESFAQAIEPQVCVAPIEFILSEFGKQKKQDEVWRSPAFYTHPRRYQMCLLVYPNGIGDGLGTHVSVYTCLMRGPFDGGLKWPFRGDVTIQIVNQAGEDNHQERVIPYTDKTPDVAAGRVTDKETSRSWGISQFLPYSLLGYDAVRSTQYLQGDSLRIQISKVKLKK